MSKTVKAAELPGSAGGFTMGVWRAIDVPVGSEVGIVSVPASGAALSGEYCTCVQCDGKGSFYGQQCDVCNGVGKTAAIAHQPPKEALTDAEKTMKVSEAEIQVDEWAEGLPYEPTITEVKARLFDLITASSGPNKALVEALQDILSHAQKIEDMEFGAGWLSDFVAAALSAAGVTLKGE